MLNVKLTVKHADPTAYKTDALLVIVPEGKKAAGLPGELGSLVSEVLATRDFTGKKRTFKVLYPAGRIEAKRLVLVGVGKAAEVDLSAVRGGVIKAAGALLEGRVRSAALLVPEDLPGGALGTAGAAVSGLLLRLYQFLEYKTGDAATRKRPGSITLLAPDSDLAPYRALAERELLLAGGISMARTVANTPAMEMNPARFAEVACEMADELDLPCEVLSATEMQRRGMNAHLAVGQGSAHPPCVVIMSHLHGPEDEAPLCLVGKGLTFDSGGLCIKQAQGMQMMKYDMCGAAAVVGAMRAIAALGIQKNVIGICAMAENMPDGNAYRPGDVLRSMSGSTIEVVNTDAEGRLVLADNLYLASQLKPAAIVDLATLTGAIVVALGTEITGLFSNNDPLVDAIVAASKVSGEPVWRMPMTEAMREQMKSDIADIKHASGARWGGSCTAATFLSTFVDNRPWAHLDIAAACFAEGDLTGADGRGVRLLVELVENFAP